MNRNDKPILKKGLEPASLAPKPKPQKAPPPAPINQGKKPQGKK
jgi:hypothetical protein